DQDIRTIGRCTFGSELDREVGDLVADAPLTTDLGRQFLYAHYDPSITQEDLDDLGLNKVQNEQIKAVNELLAIDCAYAAKYVKPLAHFSPFHPSVRR